MRIFVTGASGFIGQNLLRSVGADLEITEMTADLLDFEAVGEELKEAQPDIVVHLAARTEVALSFEEPSNFSSVNYVGTVNLVERARREVPNLSLFLFASTMETYGWQPESDEVLETGRVSKHRAFDESTPQHPNAPYAVAKLACEKYLQYAGRAYDFPWTAIRQTNSYGRVDNDFFVVEQIISQMLRSPDEVRFGDPRPYRNFLFIDDLIALYRRILERPEAVRGEVLCAGPPNAIRIDELADLIATKLKWKGRTQWLTKPEREGEIFYLNSGHARATELLDWRPEVTLDDGLDRTIAMWRDRLGATPSE